ncbi:MAG: InlB B-repeat-containing protein [Bacteroidales bacterium]|nr:InlB B-repeat-containing protein [Bacteroidales bacterium]
MKKYSLLALGIAIVLCGLLAVSCSKSSGGSDDPTPNNQNNQNNNQGNQGNQDNQNNNQGNQGSNENTLTFDVNGATGSIEAIKFTSEAKLPDASVLKFDKHAFLGWSTTKNATSPEFEAGATYKGKSTTLYAVWTEVFKITYNYNNNKQSSEFTAIDFAKGTALIQCKVEIKDNEILVWKDKDGKTYENGSKVPKAADLELTADISNKVNGEVSAEEWQYKDYFKNN